MCRSLYTAIKKFSATQKSKKIKRVFKQMFCQKVHFKKNCFSKDNRNQDEIDWKLSGSERVENKNRKFYLSGFPWQK